MSVLRFPLLLGVIGFASFASTAGVVFTSANIVASSSADEYSEVQGVNDLKPSGCTQTLTNLVVSGGGATNGSNGDDLILGSPGVDTIHGQSGNDCIYGGDSNDVIFGDLGVDVCDGGAGADSFPGADCETITP